MLPTIGFEDVRLTERFDCFEDAPAAEKLSPRLGVQGVNVFARRP